MAALNVLRWELAALWRRHGWLPFAGVVLLALAAALEVQALRWQVRSDHLAARAVAASRLPRALPVEDPVAATQAALGTFLDTLPQSKDSAATIKRIFKIAERSGVSLAQGEYRAIPDPAAKLVRHQISLPVRGEAKRIHAFVVDALNEIRPLTLESLSFRREKVASRDMDAHIQFVLVARP